MMNKYNSTRYKQNAAHILDAQVTNTQNYLMSRLPAKKKMSVFLAFPRSVCKSFTAWSCAKLETWVPQQRFASTPSIVTTLTGPQTSSGRPRVLI